MLRLPNKLLASSLIIPGIFLWTQGNSPAIAVKLVGRAVLPPDTFAPGPTSGQFLNLNNDGTVGTATTFNGRSFPFPSPNGQPVQGFSAIIPGPKSGEYLSMIDNGYGTKANSPDSLGSFVHSMLIY